MNRIKSTTIHSHCFLFLLALIFVMPVTNASEQSLINWQDWDNNLFERAKSENRMVILDLDAVWCHWCHVMEEKTYSNADVAGLINQSFIPVRVDADANPIIAARYGRWGWPATIVFDAEGNEIVKRRGYIPAIGMLAILLHHS